MAKPYDNDQTKKEQVREMFDHIAPRYDLLNHTLSMSIDRLWRRHVVRIVRRCRPRHGRMRERSVSEARAGAECSCCPPI